jgi:hypothetical protein
MSVEKLIKAAETIKNNFPEYSEEILRIAQDLSGQNSVETTNQSNLAVDNLNPNIESKYVQPPKSNEPKEVHKITFTVEVPSNYDELKIMNALLPVTKEMENSGITLKGYQFNER